MAQESHYLSRFKSRVHQRVWQPEASSASKGRAFLNRLLRILYLVGKGYLEDLLKLQALALAFKTLLSLVPFLAVCFSLLKAFGVHNRLQPFLAEILSPLGPGGEEISKRLIEFVNNVNVNALGAVGIVTLFITVMSLMGSVEEAFNHIWRVKTPRRLSRRFSDYLSVLLVGPVLLFSALAVTASLQNHGLVRQLIAMKPFGRGILLLLGLIPYLAMWGIFTFVYVLIPNTQVRLRSALLGGLVAALLWQTVGWGFAAFVASSTSYYAIYSSFAILIVFLLWLHIGWMIVLFGAEVAFAHQYVDLYFQEEEDQGTSPAGRERLGLEIMALIGLHFYSGKPPWTAEDLVRRLHAPLSTVQELLSIFTKKGLLVMASDEKSTLPARDLEQIGIKQILDAVRDNENGANLTEGTRERDGVGEVMREVDESIASALKGKSLKDLVLSQRRHEPMSALPGRAPGN
jgi:membrane protein